jgi:hypothetical protein
MTAGSRVEGVTLRQAALIAGLAYLLSPVAYAEFTLYPKLVIPGNVEQTGANIISHQGLFIAVFFSYFINFIEDIVIAWALYILLAPVNRALSLLAAWFQLIYAAIVLSGVLNLASAFRMLNAPEYLATFGTRQLHAQVNLLIHTFRFDYGLALVIFGIHLVLVGYLIVRSRYIPWWLGVLLVIDGLGWIVNSLQPYLYPNADLRFLFATFFGELIFMLWLLIAGWRIKEP